MMSSARWALVGSLGLGVAGILGCGDESDDIPTTGQLQAEIFTPRCATSGCHAGPNPSGGLSLEPPVRSKLVGVPSTQVTRNLVEAGNPGLSYLYDKVLGTMVAGGTQPMPPTGSLSDEEIALIREWIEAGAPDF